MNAEILKIIREREKDQMELRRWAKKDAAEIRTVVHVSAHVLRDLDTGIKIPAQAILPEDLSIVSLWKESREWIDSWLIWRLNSQQPVVLGRIPFS